MKIAVKQHDPNEPLHIKDVCLIHQSADVILLHVNLKTKYKQVSAFGGGIYEGVQSIWFGMTEMQMTLPESFVHPIVFAETSRYTTFVCIFRYDLLEHMCQEDNEDSLLWEAPRQGENE
jgi:hypothetical protein